MSNDNNEEQDVDLENNEDLEDEELVEEDESEEESDESEDDVETLKAEVAKYKRMAQQKAKKAEQKPEDKAPKSNESSELDYGQKAYLRADGIKGKEEIALVESIMRDSGRSLEDVVDGKFFQAELKELRESSATAKAIPPGTKSSSTSSRDKVDYWVAKGELPPADQTELRRAVVNEKIKRESPSSNFGSNTVVIK